MYSMFGWTIYESSKQASIVALIAGRIGHINQIPNKQLCEFSEIVYSYTV